MLKALEALEQAPFKDTIGWEVLINPDEEIGSPGSRHLFKEAAERNHLGLIFEPCLPEGTLVSTRKGSGNFTLVVHGKAAHAGRDYGSGRNAIVMMADAIKALDGLNNIRPGFIVNCGIIEGGTTLNTVPDLAILRFNIRIDSPEDQPFAEQKIDEIVQGIAAREGYRVLLHGGFGRAPKPITEGIQRLQKAIEECGTMLNIPIGWQPSGGVCDGNNLAQYGLPNIDTMGVRGGNIHSDQEYMIVDSLLERASLTALLLLRLASGDLTWYK
ncbi:MAG: hydrolase [Rickettsiales bacterium]